MAGGTVYSQYPKLTVINHGRVVSAAVAESAGGTAADAATAQRFTNPSADVVNAHVRLTRAPAEGGGSVFSINLVPRLDYLNTYKAGDWVEVRANDKRLIIGVIDVVSRSEKASINGSVETIISITGRDWSKVLVNTEMVYDKAMTNVELGYLTMQAAQWMESQQQSGLSFSPDVYIKNLMTLYLGGQLPSKSSQAIINQFQVPSKVVNGTADQAVMAGTLLDFGQVEVTEGEAAASLFGLDMSLLRMLRYLSHPVLNEFWFETNEDPASTTPFAVVLREYPFSKDSFEDLDEFELSADECVSVSFGKVSTEVYNFFRLKPSSGLGATDDQTAVQRLGVLLRKSISKFGLHRREELTPFAVHWSATTGNSITDIVKEWTKRIVSWHWNNEEKLQGSIVCRFRPDIRPGRRLTYTNNYSGETYYFYIDSVTHNFSYPGPSTTAIAISRGVTDLGQLLSYEQVEDKEDVQELETTAIIPSAGGASSAGNGGLPTYSGGPSLVGTEVGNNDPVNLDVVFAPSRTINGSNVSKVQCKSYPPGEGIPTVDLRNVNTDKLTFSVPSNAPIVLVFIDGANNVIVERELGQLTAGTNYTHNVQP